MLQINTGKLFLRRIGYTNKLWGKVYTFGWFGEKDLETAAGTLHANRNCGSIEYDYEILEQIEKRRNKGLEESGLTQ